MALYLWNGDLLAINGKLATHENCCCEECVYCTEGTTPPIIQVVIDGVTNGRCEGCAGINGTYSLTQDEGDSCFWSRDIEIDICGIVQTVTITAWLTNNSLLVEAYMHFTDDCAALFSLDIETPFNCNFSGLDIPPSGACDCDEGEATCTVTAVF